MLQNLEELLTVEETAELLRINRGAVYPLLQSGELKAFRNGRVWRIPKAAVLDFIQKACKLT